MGVQFASVGKPGVSYLLSHGWHSVSDLIVRSHTIFANLKQGSSFIEKSSLYTTLDPTEKSGVSYFMGMVAAKILAARLLDTPWVFHVSMINALGGYVELINKSQPDLVGLRSNQDWVVLEAKGRTWGYSREAMKTAKLQTRQLRKINGQFPALRVGVQASFSPRLSWAIEDPEDYEEEARDLEFDTIGALKMYYSSVLSASETGDTRNILEREYLTKELSDVGVTIGIDLDVITRLNSKIFEEYESGSSVNVQKSDSNSSGFVTFPDGLAISLDERWSDERMLQQPTVRKDG